MIKKNNILRLVLAAVFCAMVFTMTWISIPTPTIGNINLGDCMIIICAFSLGGVYSIFAASLGSALCDIASGYVIYAPGTFFIKGIMVIIVLVLRKFILKSNKAFSILISGCFAEIFMVVGYFIYEALFLSYGLGAAVNIPFNLIQGAANLVVAVILFKLLEKSGINEMLNKPKNH